MFLILRPPSGRRCCCVNAEAPEGHSGRLKLLGVGGPFVSFLRYWKPKPTHFNWARRPSARGETFELIHLSGGMSAGAGSPRRLWKKQINVSIEPM